MGSLAQAENDMVKRALRKARAYQLSLRAHVLGEKTARCRFGKRIRDRSDMAFLSSGAQELIVRFHREERMRMPRVGIDYTVGPLSRSHARRDILRNLVN